MPEPVDPLAEAYRAAEEAIQAAHDRKGLLSVQTPKEAAIAAVDAARPYLKPAAPEPPEGLEEAQGRAEDAIVSFGRCEAAFFAKSIAKAALDAAGLPSLLERLASAEGHIAAAEEAADEAQAEAKAWERERDALRVRVEEAERARDEFAAHAEKQIEKAVKITAEAMGLAKYARHLGTCDCHSSIFDDVPNLEVDDACTCGLTALLDRIGATGGGGEG